MIETLAVAGYRSLRDLVVGFGPLTVVTGANGSGKSSLYRALRLLSEVAQGRIVGALAAEGGLASTLWAGPEQFSRAMKRGESEITGTVRTRPVSLKLGFAADDYGYAIDLGLPAPSTSRFAHDPEIKLEAVWTGPRLQRGALFAERRGPMARVRDKDSGAWRQSSAHLASFDSMMTHCADPEHGLELLILRERMRQWRFYDHLRVDREAPARRAQVGTHTPVLAADGADVAAAIQTIIEIGDAAALAETIADAFDGARLSVGEGFELQMHQRGLLRPLRAFELSDGTLRYILIAAALLSPRPPELMILNEPEASLHGDLIAPLARLLGAASKACQVLVVSHQPELVEALSAMTGARLVALEKRLGETVIAGDEDAPAWSWPAR